MKERRNLFEAIDDFFNDARKNLFTGYDPYAVCSATPRNFLGQTFFGNPGFFITPPSMRTDVLKTEKGYTLTCELPGLKKEDIKIDVQDHVLKISITVSEDKEETKGEYVKRERYHGSFSRSFNIEGIDEDKITAKYENGILTINLVKEKPEDPNENKKIINIE